MKSFPRYSAIALGILTLTSQQTLAEETKALSSIVITATKLEQDAFDLPMSIDKVGKQEIQDGQDVPPQGLRPRTAALSVLLRGLRSVAQRPEALQAQGLHLRGQPVPRGYHTSAGVPATGLPQM